MTEDKNNCLRMVQQATGERGMDQPKKECNIHHQGNDIYWMGKLQPVTRLET